MSEVALKPLGGLTLSPGPWTCNDEAVIHDAEGHCVCVLGGPFDGVREQDVANGAAIVALPELVEAVQHLHTIKPLNIGDGEDPEADEAWLAVARALDRMGQL